MIGHRFDWGYGDLNSQQYLRGKNLIPGADIDADGSSISDGPEHDTIVELDIRNFAVSAWVNMDRLPAATDPFGVFAQERCAILTRSSIAGNDTPALFFGVTGSAGGPLLRLHVVRAISLGGAISTALPILANAGQWVFVAGSFVSGETGGKLFLGDQGTPVAEASYSVQTDGAGIEGAVNPGTKVSTGRWIDRWGFGPLLLGTYTLPVPPNEPGQFYGELSPTNSSFGSMQGLMAHVTLWGGSLTLAQWESLRLISNTLGRPTPVPVGFPPLIANWHLDDLSGGLYPDLSGNGHTMVAVPAPPDPLIRIGGMVEKPGSGTVLVRSALVTIPRRYQVRCMIASENGLWARYVHRGSAGEEKTQVLLPGTGPTYGQLNLCSEYFAAGEYAEILIREGTEVAGTVQASVELL